MLEVRPLPVTVGLCLLVLAALTPLSLDAPRRAQAVSPADVHEGAVGSRVTIVGLVADLRSLSGGGASADVSDCKGASARVYFPAGVQPPPAWTLALVGGTIQLYGGRLELRAESVGSALAPAEVAREVAPEELLQDPLRFACLPVALTATVQSGPSGAGPGEAHLVVEAGDGTIDCTVHRIGPAPLHVPPGSRLTLIGVAAVGPDGSPTVHVRV